MKRFFKKNGFAFVLLILVFCFPLVCSAQTVTWQNANQFTCGWQAVTVDVDGDALHSGDVTYQVLLANAVTDPNKTNPVVAATTGQLEALITLGVKGQYFVGVRAVWLEMTGGINWADEPVNQEGVQPWGVRFAVPPGIPPGLIKK